MKIGSTFQVLVLFMAVLLFSTPMIALAQQNSELADAVAAAEQDAKANVNQIVWGFGNLLLSGAVSMGCMMGTVLVLADSGEDFGVACLIAGWSGSILPGVLVARNYQPSPPAARLAGKSPEYVETYTQVYKAKVKNLQLSAAVPGGIVGCISIPIMVAFLSDPSGF